MQYKCAVVLHFAVPLSVHPITVLETIPAVPNFFKSVEAQSLQLLVVFVPFARVPVQIASIEGKSVPASVKLIGISKEPSVKSAQLFATIVPSVFLKPYNAELYNLSFAFVVEELIQAFHLAFGEKPPARAAITHFESALLKPPKLPLNVCEVANILYEGSIVQAEEQPSKMFKLPSSHCSVASRILFPQIGIFINSAH